MTLLFTPEELIQYMYKETSTEKTRAIDEALLNDWPLRDKLEILKASSECLDKIVESPRTEPVLRVLNYARESAIAETL